MTYCTSCYVSLDPESKQQDKSDSYTTVIVGPVIAVIALVIIGIVGCILRRRIRYDK